MSVSKVAPRGKPKLCGISVSTTRAKLGEAMGSVRPVAHKGLKGNGFRGNTREDVKRMSGDNIREVRDYGNAVPGIGSLIRGCVNGRGRVRKSRGRVRT
jgi:hypothetical protein